METFKNKDSRDEKRENFKEFLSTLRINIKKTIDQPWNSLYIGVYHCKMDSKKNLLKTWT